MQKNSLDYWKKLKQWVQEIPPIQQPMRYGNKAFRLWFARVQQNAESLLSEILPTENKEAAIELAPYLCDSLGNSTRIDYGAGHEATFVLLLYALRKISFLNKEDSIALVNYVFWNYLKLMRQVQSTYYLEPAGSHGVWSLDDYQFLPFFWGSSQLITNPNSLTPASIHSKKDVDFFADEYMYLSCIKFIQQVKNWFISRTFTHSFINVRYSNLGKN